MLNVNNDFGRHNDTSWRSLSGNFASQYLPFRESQFILTKKDLEPFNINCQLCTYLC